ncbi:MAG: carbohydrate ABC transporter permease [Bacteroidetes bacterium]|nr:carbohydrate ABC transporter permease [Bacteroidota bacterium]
MDNQVRRRKPLFSAVNFKDSYIFLFLVIWAFIVLFPIIWAFLASLKPSEEIFTLDLKWLPQNPTLENYKVIFTDPKLMRFFTNTIYISFLSTIVIVILATCAGYGFSRYKIKAGKAALITLVACQMFPPIMFIVPYFILMKNLNIYNTITALVVTRVVFYLPFCTLMIKSFFDSIPRDLEEAATVDGCSQFGTFVRIILPVVRTGVVTIFIFSFLNSWNEFLFSITVVSRDSLKTITVGLASQVGQYQVNWGSLMSMSVMSLAPPLIIFMSMQRYFIRGLTAGAVKA